MIGGISSYGVLYSYQIPQNGYAPNGDILADQDSVTGAWSFSYDAADRLVTARNTSKGIFTNDREKLPAALGHEVSHESAHVPAHKPEQSIVQQREIGPRHEQGPGFGMGF